MPCVVRLSIAWAVLFTVRPGLIGVFLVGALAPAATPGGVVRYPRHHRPYSVCSVDSVARNLLRQEVIGR